MNLRSTLSLFAGGAGSGCNPDAGKCGRPPEMHKGESGTSYAHRLSEWDRSRKVESRIKKMEPVLKEFKFKKSGENSIDLIYRRGNSERLSIDKRTGRATIQKTSYKGVRRNTMEYRTPVSANTPDTLRKQLKELFGGGPGSGCNPEAGKCGRTAEERTGKEGRALDKARKDPRQTSLYGPEHEKELQHKPGNKFPTMPGVKEKDLVSKWSKAAQAVGLNKQDLDSGLCAALATKVYDDVFKGKPGWGVYSGYHSEEDEHVFIAGHGLVVDVAANQFRGGESLQVYKDDGKVYRADNTEWEKQGAESLRYMREEYDQLVKGRTRR